jgi:hypothetical protein
MPITAAVPFLVGCGALEPTPKPEPLEVTAEVLGAFTDGPTAEKDTRYIKKVEKADRHEVDVTLSGSLPDGRVRHPGDDWAHCIAGLVMNAADEKWGPCHHSAAVGTERGTATGTAHPPMGYKDPHLG